MLETLRTPNEFEESLPLQDSPIPGASGTSSLLEAMSLGGDGIALEDLSVETSERIGYHEVSTDNPTYHGLTCAGSCAHDSCGAMTNCGPTCNAACR